MEIYILSTLLGLVIGSFLNVVIFRTEKEKSFGGRSYCPKCKKKIEWYDNVPLLSFLLLRGKCRHCHKNISIQYPLVEMFTALVFLGSAYLVSNNQFNDWLGHYFSLAGLTSLLARIGVSLSIFSLELDLKFVELIFVLMIASTLVAILVYDLKHMLIPDSFTLAGVIITLAYNILADILLVFATILPKNQIFIMEVAGISKKFQPLGWLPINLSAYLGREPDTFYGQMIHLKSYYLSLITTSRTGSGLIAGLVATLLFFSIVYVSKETWMGMGDVKLVFFLGLLLGVFKMAVALFLAFEMGAIFGVILILSGRAKMKTALPFGPFLIIGGALSLLFI